MLLLLLCLADLGTLHWGDSEGVALMAGRSAGLIMRRIRPGCMAEARALLMEQTLGAMAALSLQTLPNLQPEQPMEMPRPESVLSAVRQRPCLPAVRQPRLQYVAYPLVLKRSICNLTAMHRPRTLRLLGTGRLRTSQ